MSKIIFIFIFLIALIYYLVKKTYALAIILLLVLCHMFFINCDEEYYTQNLTISDADKLILDDLLNNGVLTANYLTVNKEADICGVKFSNGSINAPSYVNINGPNGNTLFTNGSFTTPNIFVSN